jgi:murein DD-endopeptidase MepM/ murein hydrolase activator NlpD
LARKQWLVLIYEGFSTPQRRGKSTHLMLKLKNIALLVCLSPLMWSGLASAQEFDPEAIWPLCGHISHFETPSDWDPADPTCPDGETRFDAYWEGKPDKPEYYYGYYNDLPLSSTFGPRRKKSENNRYDYHRGIDIPTDSSGSYEFAKMPVFAIADGHVRTVEEKEYQLPGDSKTYTKYRVHIRHYRPERESCIDVGCYYSDYMHLYSTAEKLPVGKGLNIKVDKGEFIGYTGRSESGFEHLHFEIRNARSSDPYSGWQRDAIHPLNVLPYISSNKPEIEIEVKKARKSPKATVSVVTSRVDLVSIEVDIYDEDGGRYRFVEQPGNKRNRYGYNVEPSWFDLEEWNFQYTHKDSADIPWDSFEEGGRYQCPYYEEHKAGGYDKNIHVHLENANGKQVRDFNGVKIDPGYFSSDTQTYSMTATFKKLKGPADCIEAYVFFARGETAIARWERKPGICDGLFFAPAD